MEISDSPDMIIPDHPYSYLSESAGFCEAAFHDWYDIVSKAIRIAIVPAMTNIHQLRFIR